MNTAIDRIMNKAHQDMTPLEKCIRWYWSEGADQDDEKNHELAEKAAEDLETMKKIIETAGAV